VGRIWGVRIAGRTVEDWQQTWGLTRYKDKVKNFLLAEKHTEKVENGYRRTRKTRDDAFVARTIDASGIDGYVGLMKRTWLKLRKRKTAGTK
jgi:hypothetical protein